MSDVEIEENGLIRICNHDLKTMFAWKFDFEILEKRSMIISPTFDVENGTEEEGGVGNADNGTGLEGDVGGGENGTEGVDNGITGSAETSVSEGAVIDGESGEESLVEDVGGEIEGGSRRQPLA